MRATMLFLALILAGCTPVASDSKPIIQPEPTAPANVTQLDTPTVLVILSERLGIPLEQLAAMPDDEITRLIEQNAAVLGLTVGDVDEPIAPSNVNSTIAFLHAQYNPSLRLLRESPIVAPGRHWLATDNQLASYALAAADDALAAEISQSLAEYGGRFDATSHGVIEAMAGEPIAWPPRTHTHSELLPGVWHEERITGAPMLDWADYADLALYGALEAWNRGDADEAHRRYAEAMTLFDGIGFDDAATDTHYATYKLALALFVGKRLNEAARPDLLAALLAKQDETGGFVTLYNRQGVPEGDASTETTSYALLALTQ